jgi:hypothetical protein
VPYIDLGLERYIAFDLDLRFIYLTRQMTLHLADGAWKLLGQDHIYGVSKFREVPCIRTDTDNGHAKGIPRSRKAYGIERPF